MITKDFLQCIDMSDVTASYVKIPWFCCVFLIILILNWQVFMSEVLYCLKYYLKFVPNFHRLCVWLMYTFWYINIPCMTAGYRGFSDLIVFFFGIFIYLKCLIRYNLIKFLQIVCLVKSVELKSKTL